MKTYQFLSPSLFIIVSALIISCNGPVSHNEMADGIPEATIEQCKQLTDSSYIDQVIIDFDPCALEKLSKEEYQQLFDELNSIYTPIDTCSCDSTLILYEFKEHEGVIINPEETLADSDDKIRPKGLGHAFFNFKITIPDLSPRYEIDSLKEYDTPEKMLIAVIDGGINVKKDSEIKKYLWNNPNPDEYNFGYNFTEETGYENMSDHGLLISKLITNSLNSEQIKLMDLRVIGSNHEGSLFDAMCAMQFAINNDVDIMNLSWGFYSQRLDENLKTYIEKAKNAGIIITASSGNDSINTDFCHHYPSRFDDYQFNQYADNVISIAYLDEDKNKLSHNSNFGQNTVSLAAPGTFTGFQGSSFAAPIVVRLAAILWSNHPEYSYRQVLNCIVSQVNTNPELLVNTKGKLDGESLDINCNLGETFIPHEVSRFSNTSYSKP